MTGDGELAAGLIAERYRLVERIGSGSMGEVWLARDELLDRPVAVKLLLPTAGLDEETTKLAAERAMREARITARLRHPHAVAVHDVVRHDGRPCLIMEYLPSRSLSATLIETGPLPPARVAAIGAQLAEALAAAHAAGIVHRDIKPGNVLLVEDGTAKITDFGISRATGDGTMTAPGLLMGTPAFLAPEVAAGGHSTFPSDVFSLGATLYTAVEGRPPFGQQENTILLLRAVANGRIEAPERAGPLTPILHGLLHPDPARRPEMADAAIALADVAQRDTPKASPPPPPLDPPTQRVAAQPPNTQEILRVPGRRSRRRLLVIGGGASVLVALGVLGGVALTSAGDGPRNPIAGRPPVLIPTATSTPDSAAGVVPRTEVTRTVPPTLATTTTDRPTTTTTDTAPPTSTAPTTGAVGTGCVASYSVTSAWPGGFQVEVTVHNPGTAGLSNWAVHWQLPDGESIRGVWNGRLSQAGSAVTVANLAWNGSMASQGSTTFGFLGSTRDLSGNGDPGQPSLSCVGQ